MFNKGSIITGTVDRIVWPFRDKLDPVKIVSDAESILSEVERLRVNNTKSKELKIWLVYWKVQSGKTNAMLASTALAFDNWYKIAIILTSNNTELVVQTRDRFQSKVFWPEFFIETFLYQDLKDNDTFHATLAADDTRLIIVAPKWAKALEIVIKFLSTLEDKNYMTIIFDDEWDNYSLDNNRKARDEDEDLPPTKINDLIFKRLRNKVDHVLVSVTWTPQWVLLEWTNESLWFKYLLEPGDTYVWWETFFADPVAENSQRIYVLDVNEVSEICKEEKMWAWLRDALMDFYVVSNLYNADTWKYAEFLCHPWSKVAVHAVFKNIIKDFHLQVVTALNNNDKSLLIEFKERFEKLKLKTWKIHFFDQFEKQLRFWILKTKIIQLNAKQKDTMTPERHHILVWWNILWRWVTIENMLVMYYWRNSKSTNMDTLYQHARMFWYRKPMLEYMKIFMPEEVYDKFHSTYETDEWLRDMVRRYPYSEFPIKFYDSTWTLRLTRPQIESKSFLQNVFIPRRQFYPNHISEVLHIKNATRYEDIEKILTDNSPIEKYKDWVLVDFSIVDKILNLIDTSSSNQWRWNSPVAILKWLIEDEKDKRIMIYTNVAERRTWTEKKRWAIWTGTLDWTKVDLLRKNECISLALSSFAYRNKPELKPMWYPTIVFPEIMDWLGKVYITK